MMMKHREARALIRQKEEVAGVTTVDEKIIKYLKSSDKLVFNNLFEIYEWDSALFDECIKQRFLSWTLGKCKLFRTKKSSFVIN